MHQYHSLLQHVMEKGVTKTDRTGTGTIGVFGWQMRFDLSEGFPLVTTKKLHLRAIVHELLWFLKGETNIKYLNDNKVSIWDEWADEQGDLGPVYGKQWRSWMGLDGKVHDQISEAIRLLKTSPDSRRIIVSAWNVGELSEMALMPCHVLFQFNTEPLTLEERITLWEEKQVSPVSILPYRVGNNIDLTDPAIVKQHETILDGDEIPQFRLSCLLYQRSADSFLGVPFNIASYALLTHMVAQVVNMVPGDFIHTFGDLHIYSNHLEQVREQLSRDLRPLPKLQLNPEIKDIFEFRYDDIKIVDYNPHPSISAPVAV